MAIICLYCLQFRQAVVRGPLRYAPDQTSVLANQYLLEQAGPLRSPLTITCLKVWEKDRN
jgi:hypothetical protein